MTSDPYAVLGVDRHDSMEDIKKAYRELAAKYHPDKYTGHELEDLAQEKMKEINEAYDRIVRERENGGASASARWDGTPGAGTSGGAYSQVRQLISEGRIDEAETVLMGQVRNAEWYFLMGSIAYRRGWFDEAQANWRNAVSMDPGNAEYNQAYRFARQDPSNIYRSSGNSMDQDICRCCSALLCADCLCGCCR